MKSGAKRFRSDIKKSIGLIMGLLLCGCSAGMIDDNGGLLKQNELSILTIGTADRGGTMYPVGEAIADVISEVDNNMKVNVCASSGSADNVRALQNEEIDLGLVSGDIAYAAYYGEGEFQENRAEELRAIAAVYPSLSNWMVPEDLEIIYVNQLVGKRIGVGPQESTTEAAAEVVFKVIGIDDSNSVLQNCGIGSGLEEMAEGKLDAVHGFAGVPIGSLWDYSKNHPSRLLEYQDEELQAVLDGNEFYYPDVIPSGTYMGQERDIRTFGTKCLLCVDASMDEELVYGLTRDLAACAEELSEKHEAMCSMTNDGFMFEELPIPLHPGAEKWYRENLDTGE